MDKSFLTWYIKDDEGIFSESNEYYAGSCGQGNDLEICIQIWNNRWNIQNDAEDIANAKLILSFLNPEDSVLLQLCTIKVNDNDYKSPVIESINRGTIDIGTLYGYKNNGELTYIDNYKTINIRFSNIPHSFQNGLKQLYLDLAK